MPHTDKKTAVFDFLFVLNLQLSDIYTLTANSPLSTFTCFQSSPFFLSYACLRSFSLLECISEDDPTSTGGAIHESFPIIVALTP